MRFSIYILALLMLINVPVLGNEPADRDHDPRLTPTVRLIQQAERAVVAIFSKSDEGSASGSGSIIHPGGFVLTCDHVVQDRSGVVIFDGTSIRPYRIVARLPEKDLSIIQFRSGSPKPTITAGWTNDLSTGEPILVGGNPGGRGIVFTSGIVSSRSTVLSLPNALAKAQIDVTYRDRFIQFDAASNRGNSGGPLINALGQQIGVVSGKNYEEENINYAIPLDTLRRNADTMIAPEIRGNIYNGLHCDALQRQALITRIDPDSPAEQAGLQVGDRLLDCGDFPITDPLHWPLSLMFRKPGQTLTIEYLRDEKTGTAELTLDEYPTQPASEVDRTELVNGLRVHSFHGTYTAIPKLIELEKVRSQVVVKWLTPTEIAQRADDFVLEYSGMINVPVDGAIQFRTGSDDGSRLWIDDQLVVDNDGHHPYQEASGWFHGEAGLHKIRIEFFEGYGDASLKVLWTLPDQEPTEIPFASLFCEPLKIDETSTPN